MSSKSSARWRPAPAVLVLRLPTEDALWLAQLAVEAGVGALEVTMTERDHRETLAELARAHPRAQVGVGSIRDAADVARAREAGSAFAVTPALVSGAAAAARDAGIPLVQGAATPTEILRAWDEGSDVVKVFPVDTLGGPRYLQSVLAPLPDIALMASGGVEPGTARAHLDAGAVSVALGASIARSGALERRDADAVRAALGKLDLP